MKNYVFKSTIFVFLSLLVFPCFSQAVSYTRTDSPGAGDVLGRPVTISYQEVRLEQALDMLEQAADITFIYSKDKIDINRRVSIEGNDTPLRNLLDVLCEKVSVHYRVQYDKVILSHKEESIKEAFTVSGQVVDGPSEEPLPGVNIRVKSMNHGTATDRDGRFILDKLTEDDVLVFSFIGYEQKEVEVQENTKDLLVRLYPQASQLSEVVVTALNITRERTRLGYAIQSLNGDNLSGNSETNVINTLSGKISGVRVTSAGGGIGSSSRIVIRGESSINGSNQPLFVVDGTPVDNSHNKVMFTSNSDNAQLLYLSAPPNRHPFIELPAGRQNEYRMSKTLVDRLKILDDPRLEVFADTTDFSSSSKTQDSLYIGVLNGLPPEDLAEVDISRTSRIGSFFRQAETPGVIMTFAELNFLKAEAALQGLTGGSAKDYYEEGIAASFDQYNVSGLASYLGQADVSFDPAVALEQIGEQKWIALYGQGLEAWNEWRRTGYPDLEPSIGNDNGDRLPVRMEYPFSVQTTNRENYKEAISRQGGNTINTKVWWDK